MANENYVGDNKWIPAGDSEKDAQKLVWSTKIINDLMVALDKGYRPQVSMPFYEGNQFLRRGNIVFEYTQDELDEIKKCANDIVYFAPFSGVEYELDNKKLVIINAEDVLAFEETPSDYQYEPLNVPVAPNS